MTSQTARTHCSVWSCSDWDASVQIWIDFLKGIPVYFALTQFTHICTFYGYYEVSDFMNSEFACSWYPVLFIVLLTIFFFFNCCPYKTSKRFFVFFCIPTCYVMVKVTDNHWMQVHFCSFSQYINLNYTKMYLNNLSSWDLKASCESTNPKYLRWLTVCIFFFISI